MNLYFSKRHIEVFLKVAELGSMSRAAESLYVTQPAVSQSIAELEEQLGVLLFERFRRRLSLTYAGEVFLDHVRRIYAIFLETGFRMEAIAQLRDEQLRIGASMTIGSFVVPRKIRTFSRRYPGVEVRLVVDNTAKIQEGLLNNSLDIGVIEGPMDHSDILLNPLFPDPLCVVCSPHHSWNGRTLLQPEEIAPEPFIMREEGSGTRSIIDLLFARHGIEYRVRHIINNIEGIKKAVAARLGISILPWIAVEEEVGRNELSALQISGVELSREFRYALHKDKIRSPVLEAWIDHLSAEAAEEEAP